MHPTKGENRLQLLYLRNWTQINSRLHLPILRRRRCFYLTNAARCRGVSLISSLPKIVELVRSLPGEVFDFDLKRFRERLQRFCKDLGIDYEVTTYTLRHTFATNLYIMGIPEKDRQAMMGHAGGSRITNDVYTTYSPDVTAAEIREIYGDFLPEF